MRVKEPSEGRNLGGQRERVWKPGPVLRLSWGHCLGCSSLGHCERPPRRRPHWGPERGTGPVAPLGRSWEMALLEGRAHVQI